MAQKYIIGDLVRYNGKISTIRAVNRYSYEDEDIVEQYSIVDEKGYAYPKIEEDEIHGIVITFEFLEKNGFKKEGKNMFKAKYSSLEIQWFGGSNQDFVVTRNSVYLRRVVFIHQLQHLLFGLGLNSEMEV